MSVDSNISVSPGTYMNVHFAAVSMAACSLWHSSEPLKALPCPLSRPRGLRLAGCAPSPLRKWFAAQLMFKFYFHWSHFVSRYVTLNACMQHEVLISFCNNPPLFLLILCKYKMSHFFPPLRMHHPKRAGPFSRSWQVKTIILFSAAKFGDNGNIHQDS